MLYYFVKITLLLWQRIYFKRIFISGTRNIPQDKPVFLASNHSNGFLDGVMVSALLVPKPTRIFVRGDVFNKSWANFILRSLKLIPIFRARDGDARTNLVNNNRSFDQLYEEFKRNRVVLIFPEADAQIEKRLRPLKKGMARMIIDMQSRDDGKMRVAVVPFGLNYTHYKHHRNELMIRFDKVVYIDDFMDDDGNERAAYNRLTKHTEEAIRRNMVDVPNEDEALVEVALRMVRKFYPYPITRFWVGNTERLQKEIDVANHIKTDDSVKAELEKYQSLLTENNLNEVGVNPVSFWNYIYLILTIIPGFISWNIMKWGLVYGKRVVDARIKKDELYESVYFGIGMAWNWILVLVGYPIALMFFGWKGALAWFVIRWFSIPYQHCIEIIERIREHKKWKLAPSVVSEQRQKLVQLFNLN